MNREDLVVGSIVWHPQYGRVTVDAISHNAASEVAVTTRAGSRKTVPLDRLEPAIPFDPSDGFQSYVTRDNMLALLAAEYRAAMDTEKRLAAIDRATRKVQDDKDRAASAATLDMRSAGRALTKRIEAAILQLSLLDPNASAYIGSKEGE